MRAPRPYRRSATRIFLIPAAVAIVTLAGLIVGLIGDGGQDAIAWVALGLPLAIIGWALRPSAR